MIIKNLIQGKFVERPNRFIVVFETEQIPEKTEKAHLRDPGRLKELLIPGVQLILRKAVKNPKRKTNYDVIAVLNNGRWVLINSGFHSDIAANLLESRVIGEFSTYYIERREFTYGKSRLDFLLKNQKDQKMLLEVKGCTLVENGLARFPDAPTVRGKKHLEELTSARDDGFESAVLFLIIRDDALEFTPNTIMDPDFASALRAANEKGVHIVAYSFENIYRGAPVEGGLKRGLKQDNPLLEIRPLKRINIRLDI